MRAMKQQKRFGSCLSLDEVIFDRSLRSKDVDGRLHIASSNITKATVNPYYGHEVPGWKELGLDANRIYKMLRDPEELRKAAPTFCNLPLLIVHKAHSARSPESSLVVGTTGSDVQFDSNYLKTSLAVWTHDGITAIETGSKRQLSCGYRYVPDMTPGVFEGMSYDGVMRNIVGNHVALVEVGRAGPDVVVSDHNPFEDLSKMRNKKVIEALRKFLPPETDLAAFDSAMSLALDAEEDDDEDEEDDPENPGKKRKKVKAMDAAAVQVLVANAIKSSGFVTKDEVSTAVAAARADVHALHKARRDVEPLVGIVADTLLTADAVYEFALKEAKVTIDGVHPSAFPALVQMASASKKQPASPRPVTQDANARLAFVTRFPSVTRFKNI